MKTPDESQGHTVYKPRGAGVWVNPHPGDVEHIAAQLAENAFAEAKSYIRQAHNLLASAKGRSPELGLQRAVSAAGCRRRAAECFRGALTLRG
jgi:hypothetical protein